MVPAPATRWSRPSTITSTRGRSRSTAAGVNALLTSVRRRVWSGGSTNSIDGAASSELSSASTSADARSPSPRSERREGLRASAEVDALLSSEEAAPSMLFVDPPDHTRLRTLVNKAFTPAAVERLRPRVEVIVDGLLQRVAGAGTMDVVEDLAYPLPVTVICELFGVPEADWGRFRAWS